MTHSICIQSKGLGFAKARRRRHAVLLRKQVTTDRRDTPISTLSTSHTSLHNSPPAIMGLFNRKNKKPAEDVPVDADQPNKEKVKWSKRPASEW